MAALPDTHAHTHTHTHTHDGVRKVTLRSNEPNLNLLEPKYTNHIIFHIVFHILYRCVCVKVTHLLVTQPTWRTNRNREKKETQEKKESVKQNSNQIYVSVVAVVCLHRSSALLKGILKVISETNSLFLTGNISQFYCLNCCPCTASVGLICFHMIKQKENSSWAVFLLPCTTNHNHQQTIHRLKICICRCPVTHC